eukprot:3909223-Pleurochrysis_carterae.AAC.1
MPRPEDPCTVNTPSNGPEFLLQLGSIDCWPSSLSDQEIRASLPDEGLSARRYASSFTSSRRASREDDTSSARAMPRPEDPCTVDTLSE